MRLVQLKIFNFRCYKDETCIDLDDLVIIIGKNDAGKSSVFDALEIFFEAKPTPEKDDVCVHSDGGIIRITCVFDNLPSEIVIDSQHRTNLASEYMLNDKMQLEIMKEYDCYRKTPKCTGVYACAKHPTKNDYNDLLSLTNSKLKKRAEYLEIDLSSVNQSVNTELRRAIWEHAEDLQCEDIKVELKSEAAKEVWDQLKKHLPIYALFRSDRPSTDQDAEAQNPLKAAVKEAIRVQEDTLNQIAEKVKEQVQQIADLTVEKIREMNPDLANQLTPRVTTKNWDTLFSVSLTGDDNIPINKRGSGTRRLILLNFFRAKAESQAMGMNTGVVYAIEEPETSQHPENQKMLHNVFEDLAEQPGCQVFITTHTPMLARRFNQFALRHITSDNGQPVIHKGDDENVIQSIVTSLGVLPDHNIKVFFGVEGKNDMNFLRTISKILHDAGEEDIPDLIASEDSGHLVFVPLGGSSLDLWVSRLKHFNRPEYYLMDRDDPPSSPPHYIRLENEINARENCTAWHTEKKELENYIHKELINAAYPDYLGQGTDVEDVPNLFAQAVHEASDSDCTWSEVCRNLKKYKKKCSYAKKRLNTEFVSKMTPELLSRVDDHDEIRGWLRKIGESLNDNDV